MPLTTDTRPRATLALAPFVVSTLGAALMLTGCATGGTPRAPFGAVDTDASGKLTFREFHASVAVDTEHQRSATAQDKTIKRYCGDLFTASDSNSDGLLSPGEYLKTGT